MVYCNEIQNAALDMSDCLSFAGISESAEYIIESSNRDFITMITEMNLNEDGIVYNEKNIFHRMLIWAVEIWGKIKGLFEAAFRKISEVVTGIVTKFVSWRIKNKDLKATLQNTDKFEFKGYKYEKIGNGIGNMTLGLDDLKTMVENMFSGKAKYGVGQDELAAVSATSSGAILKPLYSKQIAEIREDIRGSKEKETIGKDYILKNFDNIYKSVTDFKSVKDSEKKNYDELKKSCDEIVKAVKKKNSELDEKDEWNKVKKLHMNNIRIAMNNKIRIQGIELSERYACIRRNAAICMKLGSLSKNNESSKEDKQKDTNLGESSSFVNNLFDWSL
jgi:hypothetical protein